MIGIKIEFGVDELPSDGRLCNLCQEPIEGKMYVPFIQVGEAQDAKSLQAICEKCKIEKLGED